MPKTVSLCSREILEVIPPIQRRIRNEMRKSIAEDLSLPQLRGLLYCRRHPGTSLSDLAAFLELSLPSASKLVDGLLARGWLTRQTAQDDRRRMTLDLTEKGRTQLESAHEITLQRLEEIIADLSDDERDLIIQGLSLLRAAFNLQLSVEKGVKK
jgi:DNA-binding MarR family transcriptional regulator